MKPVVEMNTRQQLNSQFKPGALFMKGRKYLSHVRRRKPFAT